MKRLESMVERDWRSVVIFFMLRLAMAPCAEKMILLDRKLFLIEQGEKMSKGGWSSYH